MEAPPLERKLVAILAADIEGYSRLMGIDEEGTQATLSAHRAITDAIIAQHAGRICGTAGDSVLAESASVFAAVQSAVEIQRDLHQRRAFWTLWPCSNWRVFKRVFGKGHLRLLLLQARALLLSATAVGDVARYDLLASGTVQNGSLPGMWVTSSRNKFDEHPLARPVGSFTNQVACSTGRLAMTASQLSNRGGVSGIVDQFADA
jgi:hypothetical protein